MPLKANLVQATVVQAAAIRAAAVREGGDVLPALLLADGADYIDTGEDAAFEFATTSFSVIGFVKTSTDGTPVGAGIFSKWVSNIGYRMIVYPYLGGQLRVYLYGSGGTAQTADANIGDGEWHQVGIVVDRSADKLWVCRDQVRRNWASIATVGDVSNAGNLLLGNWNASSPADKSIAGSLACVHVYPRALADADLAAIYAAPDTPLSGCLAFWKGDIDGNTIAETAGDAGGPYTATGSGVEADPEGFVL